MKKELKIPLYIETSALQGINTNEAFFNFLSEVAKQANYGTRRPLKIDQKETTSKCYNWFTAIEQLVEIFLIKSRKKKKAITVLSEIF